MNKRMKLSQKLIHTLVILSVGSLIAFGVILPKSISYFLDKKMYNMLLAEESQFTTLGKYYDELKSRQHGIYLLKFNDRAQPILENIDDEFIHQTLMYKEFFQIVSDKVRQQVKNTETYKYTISNNTIYYLIETNIENETIVFYIIDSNNQHLSVQLFINTLFIVVIVLAVILASFFKWNTRLINNLKEIQMILNGIGEGNLEQVIESNQDIVEFEDVMYALENMRQRLYENDRVKQQMIHNISHDMKTPLAVIKNYAEGIIDDVYPYGTIEETARVIYNQADRLQKKVQGLLYLNRLEYMKSQSEVYGYFNMKALIIEVVNYMQDMDEKLQIKLSLSEVQFYGDIEKWRIVLENLIDNAKRYAKQEIQLTLANDYFTIYNDGDVIEEGVYGSVFKPFEVGKGGISGLGLAIAKKIVEIYGYNIKFENGNPNGVTFIIYK